MFKFEMTDELTMAKADEDAQRVYAKKLAADRESQKRKRAKESKEQQENRLEADRERKNRKRAEELPEQRESRLAAERESEKRRRAEESQKQQQICVSDCKTMTLVKHFQINCWQLETESSQ